MPMPLYDPRLVQPMRDELTRIGFQELRTREEVDAVLERQEATTLVVVNSVCGCAARNARPAATLALRNPKRPKQLVTVFAGQDAEATARATARLPRASSKCFGRRRLPTWSARNGGLARLVAALAATAVLEDAVMNAPSLNLRHGRA